MSPDLEHLIELQNLESAIEESRRRIAGHPQRVADAEARVAHAKEDVDAARQRLKASQEARREQEKEAATYQSRLSKFKDQLSAVKTNREYQAMQKEMEVAQAELRGVEDRELEIMVDADALAAAVNTSEAAFAARQKEVEAEKKDLAEALALTEKSLRDATAARETLVRELEPRLVTLFETLARQRKGIGVCDARDGLCSVCHVRLRPHVYQQVRANNSIIQCDSCQRILYFIPPPPPIEHPVTHRP